jgi:hypothetical protein
MAALHILPLFVLLHLACSSRPPPSESFSRSLPLDADDKYHLYWSYTDTDITFEVHVETLGFVGFGISATGGMKDADIVIGWVKDGVATFDDRYSEGNGVTPKKDKQGQDWTLLLANETETHTILKFTRPLDLCPPEDRPITWDSTVRIIWSYRAEDPSSEDDLTYHGLNQRGTKSVQLIGVPPSTDPLPQDTWTFDLKMNVTIPHTYEGEDGTLLPADTTYWCQYNLIPVMEQTNFLVKIEPIIQEGNEAIVHHVLLYLCEEDLEMNTTETGYLCDSENMPDRDKCQNIFFAWAVGAEEFYLPSHTALAITGARYIMLETHYDNPELKEGVHDTSGFRLHVSKTPRETNSGFLFAGRLPYWSQVIPPSYTEFVTQGECTSGCLTKAFDASGESEVQIFAGFLHTHLAGVSVKVRHFRGEEELPYIMIDDNYDFNFQEVRHFPKEITLKKGDNLIIECIYNTDDRKSITIGGQRTQEEMCLAGLLYYPYLQLSNCYTTAEESNFYPLLDFSKDPPDFFPKDWKSENVRKDFQKFTLTMPQLSICNLDSSDDDGNNRDEIRKSKFTPKIEPLPRHILSEKCTDKVPVPGCSSKASGYLGLLLISALISVL